ncbi:hypothetical protein [Hydrogenophaga sp. NFH-34]|uniref:hypothetical protein n=1 Tax=Hydrogenophaga sp. NFH-34 TaxID=2744446 RepID=UPI001F315DC3|nr:hypothetical protein [Hydrogenophaga sp. NFH-34]
MQPNDNPDTVSVDEHSHWEATQMEDVFLPSVRVQLGWADVEKAVDRGAIVPQHAHALWAAWAAPGSPTRVGADTHQPAFENTVADDPDLLPASDTSPSSWWRWGSLVVAALLGAGVTFFLR